MYVSWPESVTKFLEVPECSWTLKSHEQSAAMWGPKTSGSARFLQATRETATVAKWILEKLNNANVKDFYNKLIAVNKRINTESVT